ncbi:DUF4443 domain-containing protein [Candidatus Bathyarchaeota archaeon]|nr:DUF4443 domain-containing protein [Candidatus Bathyarchaeota archaeon]
MWTRMDVKQILKSLIEKIPGPTPAFTTIHFIKALELISKGPIGRGKLAKELKVGEGTIRTIIKRLKASNLITTSQSGCSLTTFGETFWKELKEKIPKKAFLERNEFSLADYTIAVLVRGCRDKVKTGLKQRDAAIMVGAEGATTLIVENGKIVAPTVSQNIAKDYPIAYKQIWKLLKPKKNDVIIVGTAKTKEKAEYGALAAALTLIED